MCTCARAHVCVHKMGWVSTRWAGCPQDGLGVHKMGWVSTRWVSTRWVSTRWVSTRWAHKMGTQDGHTRCVHKMGLSFYRRRWRCPACPYTSIRVAPVLTAAASVLTAVAHWCSLQWHLCSLPWHRGSLPWRIRAHCRGICVSFPPPAFSTPGFQWCEIVLMCVLSSSTHVQAHERIPDIHTPEN